MIEIIVLVLFCRHLAAKAAAKGRSKAWCLLGAGFWIGGEMFGGCIGGLTDAGAATYCFALCLAAIGAGIAYVIVNALPVVDGFDPTGLDPDNPSPTLPCPDCQSVQTERWGDRLVCNNCGYDGPPK